LRDAQLGDHARVGRLDDVLHFHRLEHDQRLVLPHGVAFGDGEFDDTSGHRRGEAAATAGGRVALACFFDAERRGSKQTVAEALVLDDTRVIVLPHGDRATVHADAAGAEGADLERAVAHVRDRSRIGEVEIDSRRALAAAVCPD
jgi:hypothetical protein